MSPQSSSHIEDRISSGDVDALVSLLNDQDEAVRQSAAKALGQLRDPRAVGPLMAALGGPVERFIDAVATALGEIGDPRAVPALQKSLRHPRSTIDKEALEWALAEFGASI
ncbi:MAG: HEAT repeat domain-containing protein [Anaerolineales bacterium]|jgi:HEAT repeat protein